MDEHHDQPGRLAEDVARWRRWGYTEREIVRELSRLGCAPWLIENIIVQSLMVNG